MTASVCKRTTLLRTIMITEEPIQQPRKETLVHCRPFTLVSHSPSSLRIVDLHFGKHRRRHHNQRFPQIVPMRSPWLTGKITFRTSSPTSPMSRTRILRANRKFRNLYHRAISTCVTRASTRWREHWGRAAMPSIRSARLSWHRLPRRRRHHQCQQIFPLAAVATAPRCSDQDGGSLASDLLDTTARLRVRWAFAGSTMLQSQLRTVSW